VSTKAIKTLLSCLSLSSQKTDVINQIKSAWIVAGTTACGVCSLCLRLHSTLNQQHNIHKNLTETLIHQQIG